MVQIGHRGTARRLLKISKILKITEFEFQNSGPSSLRQCLLCVYIIILPSVCLCALTLYPATDCAAATDISGVSGRCQLSR